MSEVEGYLIAAVCALAVAVIYLLAVKAHRNDVPLRWGDRFRVSYVPQTMSYVVEARNAWNDQWYEANHRGEVTNAFTSWEDAAAEADYRYRQKLNAEAAEQTHRVGS